MRYTEHYYFNSRGQTLVSLLLFTVIAITITTAAVITIYANSLSQLKLQQGTVAYYTAESGIENALIRLLRNPNYAGETLNTNDGTAVIQVSGSNPYNITSQGTVGSFLRTIQVTATYNNNVMTITSWKEIF